MFVCLAKIKTNANIKHHSFFPYIYGNNWLQLQGPVTGSHTDIDYLNQLKIHIRPVKCLRMYIYVSLLCKAVKFNQRLNAANINQSHMLPFSPSSSKKINNFQLVSSVEIHTQ